MLEKILVPLDGSELAEGVLCHIEDLARANNSEVLLLRVAFFHPFPGVDPTEFEDKAIERAENYLEEVSEVLTGRGVNVSTHVRFGDPAREILTHGDKYASVVVLTTHGRGGISRWAMGSVADRVMRRSTKPVLIVRGEQICDVDWRRRS